MPSFCEFLKNFDTSLSIRILSPLTKDNLFLSSICNSDECKKILLNAFYFEFFVHRWPLYTDNETRAFAGSIVSITENGINNLNSFIKRLDSMEVPAINCAIIQCMDYAVEIRKDLSSIINLCSFQISAKTENILTANFQNIHKNLLEINELLSNYSNSELFFYGGIQLCFEVFYIFKRLFILCILIYHIYDQGELWMVHVPILP